MLQALFSFLKIALTIESLLWYHTYFKIVCSLSEKCHWNFDRDCIESGDCFGLGWCILTTSIL